ncbi:hypothetical protein HDU96_004009, partial [Phlyctochytrium bullatum]
MRFVTVSALLLAASSAVTALRAHFHLDRREEFEHLDRREEMEEMKEFAEKFELQSLLATKGPPSGVPIPTTLAFQSVVNPLLAKIDQVSMKNWLITMTQFPERYYQSQNGVKSADWIVGQVRSLVVPAGANLTVSYFKHTWAQPSVIARYEPLKPSGLDGIVITGTHFDTLGTGSGKAEPNNNPAADDCASGSAVIFETLRTLTLNGFIPARPIEFHWYAAEEVGLYGSDAVAQAYATKGIKVVSYLNLDQSGYVKAGTTPVMGVVTDYTTKASTSFMTNIVKTYTNLTP